MMKHEKELFNGLVKPVTFKESLNEFLEATKLWRLLELAVEDFEKSIQSPNVIVNMLQWYENDGMHCTMCLAGAVLHQRTEGIIFLDEPEAFDDPLRRRLYVINYLRRGEFHHAYKMLNPISDPTVYIRDLEAPPTSSLVERIQMWKGFIASLKEKDL